MDDAKKQLADRLKSANNILVTVSRDPSIDQLAACIGLTLLLNKMNKHSVAVFSGQVPSTLEFLKPSETLEKTTDSLRDFIIALDKDKADKLRYKVEDNVVRIFITPYKTSITEKDLDFSQGDFNVDVVVALGVQQQQDLDQAITAHGRILHDATVASISMAADGGNLGTINWKVPKASSLSELVTDLTGQMGDNLLDNQIATALLTGIVAETDRFSNEKTSSQAMNASSALMAAGANQQLVASKLEETGNAKPKAENANGEEKQEASKSKQDPSTLNISHDKKQPQADDTPAPEAKLPTPQPPAATPMTPEPTPAPFTPPPSLQQPQQPAQPTNSHMQPGAKLLTNESPTIGGALNANTKPEDLDPITDPMSLPQSETSRLFADKPMPKPAADVSPVTPPTPSPTQPITPQQPVQPPVQIPDDSNQKQTLTEIEQSVKSPHLDTSQLDTARDEVSKALENSSGPAPSPIKALNAQPLGGKLHPDGTDAAADESSKPQATVQQHSSSTLPFDNTPASSDTDLQPKTPADNPSGAPPVPPPFAPPQTANTKPSSSNSDTQQSPPL